MEEHIRATGYLEGHHMAEMFNLMRENDLIWSFVVNNYLLGREPPPFDLLYWNADATRLPADDALDLPKKILPGEPPDGAGRARARGHPHRPRQGQDAHLHRRDQGGPHRPLAVLLSGDPRVRAAPSASSSAPRATSPASSTRRPPANTATGAARACRPTRTSGWPAPSSRRAPGGPTGAPGSPAKPARRSPPASRATASLPRSRTPPAPTSRSARQRVTRAGAPSQPPSGCKVPAKYIYGSDEEMTTV